MLKTNLEWIKKNVPSDIKIWKEMISEIDWKDVKKKQLNKMRMDKERIQSEWKDFVALSPAEKWDRFINGERQLGRLYQKGAIAFTGVSGRASSPPRATSRTGSSSGPP